MTGGVRANGAGDLHHLAGGRHFQIERLGYFGFQPKNIIVNNMPAILAQMRGDAVGAGRDRDLRRLEGIGMPPAARIAHGGDVIDIDAEADGKKRAHGNLLAAGYPLTRSAAAITFFARNCEMIEVRCLRL